MHLFISLRSAVNYRVSIGVGLRMLLTTEKISNPMQLFGLMFAFFLSLCLSDSKNQSIEPICNISAPRSDLCQMTGDIRIHGNSSTIFIASTQQDNFGGNYSWSWTIKPYARKGDKTAMAKVRKFTVKVGKVSQEILNCTRNRNVPAIVFSTAGYMGNHFHDFTDVLIPLFLTSREFNGEVQFLITNKKSWWIRKYETVLKKLSRYEIIDIDKEEGVLCFPSMIVGLKTHKELSIDPSKSPYSMKDFKRFLRSSYSLKRETAIKLRDGEGKKPRLLIISRRRTRSFMNKGEIASLARSLGYDVVVKEAYSNLSQFSELVNSCDVMMGVHGAGLTNMVFLPENAVLIQVVPLGRMAWLAKTDFGEPAKDMNLRYLEYEIREGESSLIHQYPLDHQVLRDPYSISKKGWDAFRAIYMDKQDVKIDISRFRKTLLEALKLLHM
ncbi:unnamed protein product [Ilex paraguariensis]|uniref:Glycosyltransferase 61 catalytic domain-containing protein n=1 Tax=Ilex paraguariensis TaxID=185542 RepID=A0ABC8UX01_9AQUA